MRAAFQLQHAQAEFVALARELLCIDLHAVALDAEQHFAGLDFQLVDAAQLVFLLELRPQGLVYLQGKVGILAGIYRGLTHRHLAEGNLAGTLAAQVFVAQAAAVDMALGQAFQSVRLVRLQHIALQHGVVDIATHLDAVIGEHMPVVLDVLAQLGVAGIFQPGSQALQHLVQWQLFRRFRRLMAERDIGRLPRLHTQADAQDARLQRIERGGFGIQGRQLSLLDAGEPGVKV